MHDDWILVLNCGSSSIKFAAFDADVSPLARKSAHRGQVDGIGGANAGYESDDSVRVTLSLDAERPFHAALTQLLARIADLSRVPPRAVAHRVVHGGSRYAQPVRVDAAVLADLKSYIPLAPLHQPFALEAIEAMLRDRPDVPQIACFDTAFHATMPDVEKQLALPREEWTRGLRRYGFHGLSYAYLATALGERYGAAARGRSIVAHLGSGASLCAMRDLRSVATTMGFSALDGLMMGTRCGALDPGALLYLLGSGDMSVTELGDMLYHRSGLLGVSGLSADPRELLKRENETPAREALALYVRGLVREIGALVATLGGLDLLAFSAGIGEHNAVIRARVCAAFGFLGVVLDDAANSAGARIVSSAASRVLVVVEPTNEEWIAATAAAALVG